MAAFNSEIESGFNILNNTNEGNKKSHLKKEIDASYIQFHFMSRPKWSFSKHSMLYCTAGKHISQEELS